MNILFSILQQASSLMPNGIPARTSGRLLTALLRLLSLQPHGALNDVFFPEEFIQLGRIFQVTGSVRAVATLIVMWKFAQLRGF